jgi:hypothetical protein
MTQEEMCDIATKTALTCVRAIMEGNEKVPEDHRLTADIFSATRVLAFMMVSARMGGMPSDEELADMLPLLAVQCLTLHKQYGSTFATASAAGQVH